MPAAKEPSIAYIFFNCDGEKSLASKNIFYNKAVYGRTQLGRKALWKKIQEEMDAKRVVIPEDKITEAQDAILKGDPMDAGKLMQFGDIIEIDRY